jgi:MFS family permease
MSIRDVAAEEGRPSEGQVESRYAWMRLIASLVIATIGNVGMWAVVVVLPAVEAEFGVARADASLPYTVTLIAYSASGILVGRLADRIGIVYPLVGSAIVLGLGYVLTSQAGTLWQFAILHALLVGAGSSATFAPLLADISHWFTRHRGIAVAICASGNYMAGTVWPPLVQRFMEAYGWRSTFFGVGIFCLVTILPLVLVLRRNPPHHQLSEAAVAAAGSQARLGISPNVLMALLALAGVACCVAMSMPQVHIVAYCGDLGYGPARGAEMLSLMLGLGVVSRLASGWIADRIGGLATVLLGSTLQAVALFLYLPFDSLPSLYVISGLFGLFQGGIVPSYAIVVREYFSPREAGTRVSIVLMSTTIGMALGGWLSGALFDLTGDYQAAFINGILWNVLNIAIILWLLMRKRSMRMAPA